MVTNPNDLITLTADDLAGCAAFVCKGVSVSNSSELFDAEFVGSRQAIVFVLQFVPMKVVAIVEIQAHPHDYIRAWLANVGRLFHWATEARVWNNRLILSSDKGGYFEVIIDCPPALATAMGDGVWKRTENGWEVQG